MIKTFILTGIIVLVIFSQKECNNNGTKTAGCFKGRLAIKGICSNYTINVIEGNLDSSKISKSWTDENTNNTYNNVFALDNPCTFPADIKQGDEFYFSLREEKDKDCNVCMAYYPTPPKRLAILVSKTSCP
jgi:hypothetical protein